MAAHLPVYFNKKLYFCKDNKHAAVIQQHAYYFLFTISDTEGWLILNKFAKNNCDRPSS